ncbi:MAG: hypothetical protein AB7G11_17555, partial [Phycisphaerales bacterium]
MSTHSIRRLLSVAAAFTAGGFAALGFTFADHGNGSKAHVSLVPAGSATGTVSAPRPTQAPFPPDNRAVNGGFVNWENPHVHPLDITPDGSTLLAVNTPDNRLQVFTLTPGGPISIGAVQVGLDPVSVRARTSDEVWVVNHISDSISIVNLATMSVVNTIKTLDEPADVVFAGNPVRAFVTCSQANTVQVFDPASPAAAPQNINIEGEDPRALAVSPDGLTVYAAIFESGNGSTVLGGGAATTMTNIGFPPNVVDDNNTPYGPTPGGAFNPNVFAPNPPPNSGALFSPPINPVLNPQTIPVSLIVKKNPAGRWMDDNAHDWTDFISGPMSAQSGRVAGWDLVDQDVAAISTSNLSVSYATRLMNICMSLAVNPASGRITVIGTDATNEVRFEPNVNGRFIRVNFSSVDPADLASHITTDLNPHLTYAAPTIPQSERDRSLGDPRGIAWNAAGSRAYVTGMGSNSVIIIDSSGTRAGLADHINVGEGPTGVVLDEPRSKAYVLNKFASSISVIDTTTETQTMQVAFYDPSPSAIKLGRKHLYDTHKNSGLGQIACASCHVDARKDNLGWDLGDPAGILDPVTGQNLGMNVPGLNTGFQPFHPMKGPMTTQTLQDIVGQEPFHWRGDRDGIENFNGAFIGLQGDDTNLTNSEMQEFENFLATITFPPNPFRNFDNSLPTALDLTPLGQVRSGRFGSPGQPLPIGSAVRGLALYRDTNRRLDGGALACVTCHTLPTGAGADVRLVGATYQPFPVGPMGEHHRALVSIDGLTNISIKTPQLRNEYEKTGFNAFSTRNTAGFGVLHDGSVDTLARFVGEPVFNVANDQEVADLTAFVMALSGSDLPQGSPSNIFEPPGGSSKDSHAFVGAQTTVLDGSNLPPAQVTLLNNMIAQANLNKVGLVVKGRQDGREHGWVYIGGGTFQTDQSTGAHVLSAAQLLASAAPGAELTYTVVPIGTQNRIGVDRDNDMWFDGDELAVCSDPANPAQFPGSPTCLDQNG